jgi:hypothetical protein
MSTHDGTDMALSPFKGGDKVIVKNQPGLFHATPAQRFAGKVCEVLDTVTHHPHHLSHGWYYWLSVPEQFSEVICWENEIEKAPMS